MARRYETDTRRLSQIWTTKATGATNVARLCGTKIGVVALVLDVAKSFLPVLLARAFSDSSFFLSLVILAAVAGHMFSVFLYGKGDSFQGRIDARKAQLESGAWALKGAWVSDADGASTFHANYRLPTTLTPAQIQESFASPSTISFWDLPRFIATAQAAGFSATRYLLYFDTLLVMPAMFAAMVFMAASFSLRLARLGGLGRVVVYSAMAGFGGYFFGDVTKAFGGSGILPVGLAASAPGGAGILLGVTLVFPPGGC